MAVYPPSGSGLTSSVHVILVLAITVNFTSVENCVLRKESSTITFLCNHAIRNVRSFSTEVKFTVYLRCLVSRTV